MEPVTAEREAELHSNWTAYVQRLESDRDAGWAAAEKLAGALDELLYAIRQWRQGGMRAEGCQLAEAGASKALAAYTAARAKRTT